MTHDEKMTRAAGKGNRRIRRAAGAGRWPLFVWLVNRRGWRLAHSDVAARRIVQEFRQ